MTLLHKDLEGRLEATLDRFTRQLLIIVSEKLETSVGEIDVSEATNEAAQYIKQLLEAYTEDRAVAAREDVYRDFVKETDALKLKADMSAVAVAGELTRALKRVVIKSPLLKKEEPDV